MEKYYRNHGQYHRICQGCGCSLDPDEGNLCTECETKMAAGQAVERKEADDESRRESDDTVRQY